MVSGYWGNFLVSRVCTLYMVCNLLLPGPLPQASALSSIHARCRRGRGAMSTDGLVRELSRVGDGVHD